jgi:tRNA(Ile)-lysidine synthase
MPSRPRLTPAIADVRRAVRESLSAHLGALPPAARPPRPADAEPDFRVSHYRPRESDEQDRPPQLVLVGLSGGADSLALAAATAFEGPRAGFRVGAVIVDHGLQDASAAIAEVAAAQARALGLDPVIVTRVEVGTEGGPEAAARAARYAAFEDARRETGATAILLAHTLDDQAESVLLGLARGSGSASARGMAAENGVYLRPLLGIRRSTTEACCTDSGLTWWNDPQNADRAYARVRIRRDLLPALERDLGPGFAEALARTAEQLREDSEALDHMAEEVLEELVELEEAGLSVGVAVLAANPPALRQRIIRAVVAHEFHVSLSRAQTLEVARLVTDWHGQGPLDLPGIKVERAGGRIHFISTTSGELTGHKPPHEH